MTNNSSTGGYLNPVTQGLPGGLTITQFIQSVLVGLSALKGSLIRPKWQVNEPEQPDIEVNWLAFAISSDTPDANAYVAVDQDGNNTTQRQELLEIQCSFYGPDALENATIVRDGFQIQQNLEGLSLANMGFAATDQAIHTPELINERFFNRYDMNIFLRRQIQRVYPILTLVSASGIIHTVTGNEEYLIDWSVET